jgi:thioredoxin reductase (NADPH)
VSGGKEYKVDCVFILKDTISLTKLVPGVRYEDGRIIVDGDMATSVPGVFAAGDCTGKPFQLAKAVGEGNAAALSASRYIDEKNI